MIPIIPFFFASVACVALYQHWHQDVLLLLFGSLFLTASLFSGIAKLLGSAKYSKGFGDFIRGDEGGYSLSRLQAVAWAIALITYHISVILLMMLNDTIMYYQLVFSEASLWLLGLSLGSYVSVKGITLDKIQKRPARYKTFVDPKWSNLITSDNGLDFSKFQMLVWTVLALFIFETKCYYHLQALQTPDRSRIEQLFNTQLDEFTVQSRGVTSDESLPPVPYLPWSFVVLMGMSQGAYVGKKLLPSFKLDGLREAKAEQLSAHEENLKVKLGLLQNITSATPNTNISALDKAIKKGLQDEISKVEKIIKTLNSEIAQINRYDQ